MKSYLTDLVRSSPLPEQQRNFAREYLQARILGILQREGAMIPLAFHGGTALRFLYGSGRFSEDLDFALERRERGYDFRSYLQSIRTALAAEGYTVELRVRDDRVVHSAFVRFPGLPFELGLSPHQSEVLAVKIEVDTNPPAGAVLATTLVRRHVILQLQHHDQASLFAGKLHAILQRPHLKGRDIFDLVWYVSDPTWPEPNLALLANALEQTGWRGPAPAQSNWRRLVRERLLQVDWKMVVQDVHPFLDHTSDETVLSLQNVLKLIG